MERSGESTLREEKRRFDSSVGSLSDDRNQSEGPSITINRGYYNSLDGPPRLNEI